jgi:hypothetical protein
MWIILSTTELDNELLQMAIDATFTCRNTQKPQSPPIGLTIDFAKDPQKMKQWDAFIRKNQLQAPDLNNVVEFLQRKLLPHS